MSVDVIGPLAVVCSGLWTLSESELQSTFSGVSLFGPMMSTRRGYVKLKIMEVALRFLEVGIARVPTEALSTRPRVTHSKARVTMIRIAPVPDLSQMRSQLNDSIC